MLYFFLSIIIFAVPITICYVGYLNELKELEKIKKDLEFEKENSKNLEYIYYNLIKDQGNHLQKNK